MTLGRRSSVAAARSFGARGARLPTLSACGRWRGRFLSEGGRRRAALTAPLPAAPRWRSWRRIVVPPRWRRRDARPPLLRGGGSLFRRTWRSAAHALCVWSLARSLPDPERDATPPPVEGPVVSPRGPPERDATPPPVEGAVVSPRARCNPSPVEGPVVSPDPDSRRGRGGGCSASAGMRPADAARELGRTLARSARFSARSCLLALESVANGAARQRCPCVLWVPGRQARRSAPHGPGPTPRHVILYATSIKKQ